MRLRDFTVLSFDCYGTLVDWETGILSALQPLLIRAGRTDLNPELILNAFARHEAAQERATPSMLYSDLLVRVHDRVACEWGVAPEVADSARFGASVGDWPAFEDSSPALEYLKRYYRLAILSNVDRDSFAISNARLGIEFDFVFTAEDIGSYKPNLRNFQFMIEALEREGIHKRHILHTAQSLFHDHVPANQIGLASAWINRRKGRTGVGATPSPAVAPKYDFEFASLEELLEAHKRDACRSDK